jgi:hypothetical protein
MLSKAPVTPERIMRCLLVADLHYSLPQLPPAYIVLETTVGEAVWISAMGVQTVRLDAPLQRPILPAKALPEWFDAGAPVPGLAP